MNKIYTKFNQCIKLNIIIIRFINILIKLLNLIIILMLNVILIFYNNTENLCGIT